MKIAKSGEIGVFGLVQLAPRAFADVPALSTDSASEWECAYAIAGAHCGALFFHPTQSAENW